MFRFFPRSHEAGLNGRPLQVTGVVPAASLLTIYVISCYLDHLCDVPGRSSCYSFFLQNKAACEEQEHILTKKKKKVRNDLHGLTANEQKPPSLDLLARAKTH